MSPTTRPRPSDHRPVTPPARRLWLQRGAAWALSGGSAALGLGGCALLGGARAPRVELAGIEPLTGEGLELRLLVKLRVKNPGEVDLSYDGLWLELDIDGKGLATGGAPVKGTVPRYGETVVALPMTISGFALVRQAWGLFSRATAASSASAPMAPVRYRLRGHLGGTGLASGDFDTQGELDLGKPPA